MDCLRRALDRDIEAVQAAQKFVAAEGVGRKRVDHILNLEGDDVAAGKAGRLNTVRKRRSVSRCWISISSTASSDRFGLIDWRHLSKNSAKAAVKVWLVFPFLLDQLGQALPDIRDPVLELSDGLLHAAYSCGR